MKYRVGFEVKKISNLIKKRIDCLSRKTDLTGFQGYLMGFLIREGSERDIFQRDVEKHMEISRASVTSVLQLLEKNGFIQRVSVENDARLKKIVVTEKGIQADRFIRDQLDQLDVNLVDGIPEEDMQVFISVMERMRRNLERLDNLNKGEEENAEDITGSGERV